jgi:hypothetical protein
MIIRADRFLCPVWVTSDKAHIEHNESALALIAGVPSDMDFHRNGPIADSCGGLVAVARADILDEELRHLGRVQKIRNQTCPSNRSARVSRELDRSGTRNRTRTGITLRPHDRIDRSAHTLGGFHDTQCAKRFAIEDFTANVR